MDSKLKSNFQIELSVLKIIPIILALLQFIMIMGQFFGIYFSGLGLIGSISLIPLLFLYLSSYVFKFCFYHRISLHYLLITQILCIVDLYIEIPISLTGLCTLHIGLFIILIFLLIIFFIKNKL